MRRWTGSWQNDFYRITLGGWLAERGVAGVPTARIVRSRADSTRRLRTTESRRSLAEQLAAARYVDLVNHPAAGGVLGQAAPTPHDAQLFAIVSAFDAVLWGLLRFPAARERYGASRPRSDYGPGAARDVCCGECAPARRMSRWWCAWRGAGVARSAVARRARAGRARPADLSRTRLLRVLDAPTTGSGRGGRGARPARFSAAVEAPVPSDSQVAAVMRLPDKRCRLSDRPHTDRPMH